MMKTLIITLASLLFASAVFAGEGPGTECETLSGHTITVNTPHCPTATTKL